MFAMTAARQRGWMLTAYTLLLLALVVQPLYFMFGARSTSAAARFGIVPPLCLAMVALSAIIAVLLEQRSKSDTIRDCASSLIRIVMFLIILGLSSAIQSSSWWRIESTALTQFLNFTVVPATIIITLLVIKALIDATRTLPRS